MIWHPNEIQLNDYADGELAESEHHVVAEHLAACAECASAVRQVRQLLADAAALPASMEPPSQLWQQVRNSTISPRPSRARMLWELRVPLAAAATVLIVAASALTWWIAPTGQVPQPVATSDPAPAGLGLARAEADYLEATNTLLLVLEERRDRMDPVVVATVEQNLRVIAAAVENAKQALAADPANQDVTAILNATYQTQIRMLRNATRVWGET